MQTALITGANKGIGLETARQLAQKGWRVILTARNEQRGKAAQRKLHAEGLEVGCLLLDVSDSDSIPAVVEQVQSSHTRIDALINNAAILLDEGKPFLSLSEEELRQTIDINTFGPLWVTRAFLPLLKAGSRVINISSGAGTVCGGMGTWAPWYSVSKASLNAVTMQLAHALDEKGILVNAICPGWVRTDMGGAGASRSIAEGADTPVWMASDPYFSSTGKFFRDRKEIEW
ncbi:MAG: SDR family oxidoreductase [Bacteroidota bacterium]